MARVLSRAAIQGLRGSLRILRGAPRLLVFDFDGTLSPLARRPEAARISAGAARALRILRAQKGTVVAVLSGRSLGSLRRMLPKGLILVGNHGLRASRRGLGLEPNALSPYRATLRSRIVPLRKLAAGVPGALVEGKGVGAALHYRAVAAVHVPDLLKAALLLFRGSGFRARAGKKVLEFVPPVGQGKAGGLRRLSEALAPGWRRAGACLFVGDDLTDEDAFRAARALGKRALAIKVGPGPTAAALRLVSRSGVDDLLDAVASFPRGNGRRT
ncbi:MAG: trehalose-phosphatase [bacterium]